MEKSIDIENASLYYSINMIRCLLNMSLITQEEYQKILSKIIESYGTNLCLYLPEKF